MKPKSFPSLASKFSSRQVHAPLAAAWFLTFVSAASAAPFTAGNLTIYRVGSGTGSLINTGNEVFIDEYTPAGSLVQSIPMPTAVVGANKRLIASGTATSDGLLTRSEDGQFLIATGYDATPPVTSLTGTTAATVNRVIARLDAAGAVDTTTALTDAATSNNVRGATSSNGTDFWITGGAGGIRHTTLGGTTSTQLSTTVVNLRQPAIVNGQLLVSTGSGTAVRIGTVGSGLPTTAGQTITNLPGFPSSTGGPYSFFFADLDFLAPGIDTLYVADDTASALTKYSLVAGSWTSNGIVGVDADDYRGVTGTVSGSSVTLFATRKGGSGTTGGGEMISLVDSSGYNGAFAGTPTLLATAATNTAFRGIALAPVSVPPPVGTVSISASSVAEGNGGTSILSLTVTRTNTATAFAVNYAVTGGTATAGSDFTTVAPGTLNFPAGGAASQTIDITVNGDTTIESNETVALTLSGIVDAFGVTTLDTATANGTITNDDSVASSFPASGALTSTVKGNITLAGAEIPAFDPISKRGFTSSNVGIQVVDLADPAAPVFLSNIAPSTLGVSGLTSNDVSSIAVRKGAGINPSILAAAIISSPKSNAGYVVFLDAATGALLGSTPVGAVPDHIAFTPDGTKLLVANEGELDGAAVDISTDMTVGSISIIDLAGGVATPTVTTADFTSFDAPATITALSNSGVRIFQGGKPSTDFEPEYFAISADGAKAMVTLQEANAVAVLDIATATFTSVVPLGKKNFSSGRHDFSDRDGAGASNLVNPTTGSPVFGLYTPDAVASYSAGGQTYYVTANEGDDRNDFLTPDESTTVGSGSYDLDDTVFPNELALKNQASLGRLTVSNAPGLRGDTDNDGDIDEILSYGGRSFTILNAAGGLVFDSGDMIENIMASQFPTNFDDSRSDNKGPEPEGVTIASIGGRTYAFVGLERSHMVLAFDVTNPLAVTFTGGLRRSGDLNPEGLVVVSAADSPSGKPLLLVANEVSNNLTIHELNNDPFATWLGYNGYTSGGIDTDSDGDGLTDRVEFFFNQNPNKGGDFGNLPQLVPNGGAFELDFTRLNELGSTTGTLKISTDLTSWTTALLGTDYTVASSIVTGDETAFTYVLPGTGPSAPGVSPTYLVPNTTTPTGASLGGIRVVNEGLVGAGRITGDSVDSFGETQGAASGLFITDWRLDAGLLKGTFNVLPDRGYNTGTFYSNYAARLHRVAFTFTPYYGAGPVAQNQIDLLYVDTTKFTYQDGPTTKFTTGLNPGAVTGTLFGQTVGLATGANGPGGATESLLSFDAEAVHLFSDWSGYVSDEYGAYIARFNPAKKITGLTQLPEAARPHRPLGTPNFDASGTPAPLNGRRNNQGLEGLSVTPDGTRLFALLQSATVQDTNGSQQQTRTNARLFVYDVAGANRETPVLIGEYIVKLPQIDLNGNNSGLDGTAAQSEIVAIGDSAFLMLPRDGNGMGKGTTDPIVFKSVQLVDFASATNIMGDKDGEGDQISPGGTLLPTVNAAATAEVINMLNPADLAKFGFNTNTNPSNSNTLNEKMEGMALVPDLSTPQGNDFFLFVANDNDFQSANVQMLDETGVIVSKGDGRLNAGITNDAIFYAYRITIEAGDKKFFRFGVK
ncbi:MAG: choice-of-anchor I family protein [Verrucomicrobiota bacterium]